MFNIIIPISLLLISGGIAVMYITPKYDAIKVLRGESTELSNAIKKTEDIDATSKELSEKMRSIPLADMARLERLLPAKEKFDELRFVNDLQGVGERSGLSVKDIVVDEKPADAFQQQTPSGTTGTGSGTLTNGAAPGYLPHKFSFSVTAPYGRFVNFLKDLERSLEFADITSVSLANSSQAGKQSGGGSYEYKVEFVTYSLK